MAFKDNLASRESLRARGEGVREDLSGMLHNLEPTETPFMTLIGRGPKPSNTKFEWQEQGYEEAGFNDVHEGAEFLAQPTEQPVRLANVAQNSNKEYSVTGTADAVNTAGRSTESGRIQALKAVELKRDQEFLLTARRGAVEKETAADVGDSDRSDRATGIVTDRRVTAGAPAFIRRNLFTAGIITAARAASAVAGNTYAAGVVADGDLAVIANPADADGSAVAGTRIRPRLSEAEDSVDYESDWGYPLYPGECHSVKPGPLSQRLLDDAIRSMFRNSSSGEKWMLFDAELKQKFSRWLFKQGTGAPRIAPFRHDVGSRPRMSKSMQRLAGIPGGLEAYGAVNIYHSDFGDIFACPDHFQAPETDAMGRLLGGGTGHDATRTNVLLIDPKQWGVCYLRPYHREMMGKRGDAREYTMRAEYGLKCMSDKSSACIADVDPSLDIVDGY